MNINSKNSKIAKSSINELFHSVRTALIEEQLTLVDQSEKLTLLYEELLNRDRLDVYEDAVNSAISQSGLIRELKSGSAKVRIKADGSKFEFAEFLRKAFEVQPEQDDKSIALKFMDILKIIGMDDSSFICNVTGQSMIEANIFEGDTLIVNRTKNISDGDFVVVKLFDEILVKKYIKKDNSEYFYSENENYQPYKVDEKTGYEILGIVKSVIHKF